MRDLNIIPRQHMGEACPNEWNIFENTDHQARIDEINRTVIDLLNEKIMIAMQVLGISIEEEYFTGLLGYPSRDDASVKLNTLLGGEALSAELKWENSHGNNFFLCNSIWRSTKFPFPALEEPGQVCLEAARIKLLDKMGNDEK